MPTRLISLILAVTVAMPCFASGSPPCEKKWRQLASKLDGVLLPVLIGGLAVAGGGAVFVARKQGVPQPILEKELPVLSLEQIRECLQREIAKYKTAKPMVHFPVDGCYTRAADFIEQVQKACLTELKQVWISGSLKPCDSVSWAWHTAAAFRGPDGAVYVVDPGMSDEPILIDSWQGACRGERGDISKVFFSQCTGPRQLIFMQTTDARVESIRCRYGCYGTLAEAYANCDRGEEDKKVCQDKSAANCQRCEKDCGEVRVDRHSCDSVPRQGFGLPKLGK